MYEPDESIIHVGPGAARDLADRSRNDPVGKLAEKNERQCDRQRLQIDVRTDQLGQPLDLFDHFIQRRSARGLVIWVVFVFVSVRHAEGADVGRLIIRAVRSISCARLHAGLCGEPGRLRGQCLYEFVGNVRRDIR